jgi:outer membrane protein OmpA-like peptidoglycan-associated protein
MYLIFFDFDSAALTPRARDIVAEAVRNSARIPHTRIEVSGNADRAGDPAYNQRLSQARAEAVAAEMGRWGVPRSAMDIHSYGDTRPLVPTAVGVREPQNRRVEIVYR